MAYAMKRPRDKKRFNTIKAHASQSQSCMPVHGQHLGRVLSPQCEFPGKSAPDGDTVGGLTNDICGMMETVLMYV